MCLEDLKLGKGYAKGASVQQVDSAAGANILGANYNRVALIVTVEGPPVATSIFTLSLQKGGIEAFASFNGTNPIPYILKLEHYGQVLQSPIWTSGSAVGAVWRVIELVTPLNVPPLTQQ